MRKLPDSTKPLTPRDCRERASSLRAAHPVQRDGGVRKGLTADLQAHRAADIWQAIGDALEAQGDSESEAGEHPRAHRNVCPRGSNAAPRVMGRRFKTRLVIRSLGPMQAMGELTTAQGQRTLGQFAVLACVVVVGRCEACRVYRTFHSKRTGGRPDETPEAFIKRMRCWACWGELGGGTPRPLKQGPFDGEPWGGEVVQLGRP